MILIGPRISELLQKLRNFKYATAIDLSMGYYHIPLDEASQKLCTTVLPWGKFRYKVLPMGIKNSPDIFQEIINNMFCDLEFTSAYLDDILIISDGSYQDHLDKVKVVLERLQKAHFRANMKKCLFAETNIKAISPERLFNHCLGVSGYVDLTVHGATCTGHKPMEVPVMMLNCIFCSQMVDALAFA